jgi:Tfp pilus assembly protein PilO
MSQTNKMVVAMLAVAALAVAFWMMLLSPKRQEASDLGNQASQLRESLAQHRAEISEALTARRQFPVDYQQLVVLGKAVPGGDETASLLVQLNQIANGAGVRFQDFTLAPGGGSGASEVPPPPAESGSTPASATEVAASLLPLGATIGPAGLAVMPYTLKFKGDFFHIADFIHGLDSLVKSENSKVAVNGRLMTINSFSLQADSNVGFPALEAEFSVTTYLTPPSQGVTAGATPAAPAESTATPASATTGGAP